MVEETVHLGDIVLSEERKVCYQKIGSNSEYAKSKATGD